MLNESVMESGSGTVATPTPMPTTITTTAAATAITTSAITPETTTTATITVTPQVTVSGVEVVEELLEQQIEAAAEQSAAKQQEQQQQQSEPLAQDAHAAETGTTTATMTTTTTLTMTNSKEHIDMDPSLINFKVLYVLTQLCGLTMIVLVGIWISAHFGGLGGTAHPSLEFNWHPLLMTIGFIFLYGNSILVYRGFRHVRKHTLKLWHAGIHVTAFVVTLLGSKAVYDSHAYANPPIPHLYSLHSWLGLTAILLFILQYVGGFVAYLSPGAQPSLRNALMPYHVYFGLTGFVMAIASACMGLTEKAIFANIGYSQYPAAGILANFIGLFYVIFGGLVVYLATEASYKRKPLPEDAALLPETASR